MSAGAGVAGRLALRDGVQGGGVHVGAGQLGRRGGDRGFVFAEAAGLGSLVDLSQSVQRLQLGVLQEVRLALWREA